MEISQMMLIEYLPEINNQDYPRESNTIPSYCVVNFFNTKFLFDINMLSKEKNKLVRTSLHHPISKEVERDRS